MNTFANNSWNFVYRQVSFAVYFSLEFHIQANILQVGPYNFKASKYLYEKCNCKNFEVVLCAITSEIPHKTGRTKFQLIMQRLIMYKGDR